MVFKVYLILKKGENVITKLFTKIFTSMTIFVMFLFLLTFNRIAHSGELLVYSSTDADNLKYYMDEFQKANPDIKVNVVRESTGTMAAKMMAEKDNPQADFLFEMAATVALNMLSLIHI